MLEHILVVEDDEFMRMSLQTELELAGYAVTVAENGERALQLASQQHFDLVVSDIRMPGKDGLETLSGLRELQPLARNILISGYADPDAPVKAVKLKVDDYLMKPFSADEFLAAVKKALQVQLQELQRERQGRSWRRLWLCSLRSLQDLQTAQRNSVRIQGLARRAGLSPARIELLELACWVCPLDLNLKASPEVEELVQAVHSGSQRLEARLIRQALGPEELQIDEEQPDPSPSSSALLALAHSYADSGQSELALQALERVLEQAPDAAAWLLHHRLSGQLESAQKALEYSKVAGLERLTAQALLALGQFEEALQLFSIYQDLEGQCRCWLGLGQAQALVQHLSPDSRLWWELTEPLAKALQGATGLEDLVLRVGERALGMLQLWSDSQSPLQLRLKALDLLALLDTPAARQLLSNLGQSQVAAVAAKSQLLAAQSQSQQVPSLQVYLLGRLRFALGGALLEEDGLAAKKTRGLLAYLAYQQGRHLSEEVLMETFWPHAGAKARHSLHNAIYQIRKFLKAYVGDVLYSDQGYRLDFHPQLVIDTSQFQAHLKAAEVAFQGADSALAASELKKAELLYGGDFLEGLYEEWVIAPRQTLVDRLQQLLQSLAAHFASQGRHEVSLDYWRRLLSRDNCHEEAYQGAFLSLLELGRPAEAVRLYHQCSASLRQELGVGPPPRLVELYLKATAN